MILAEDLSAYAPIVKDWGTAGIIIVVFGAALWWALPRILTIAKLVNDSVSTLERMTEGAKKDQEDAAEKQQAYLSRAESILQRAEEMYPKPQPKSGFIHTNGAPS